MSTEAGFDSTDQAVADIKQVAENLERSSLTPRLSENLALIDGRWEMLYSSFGLPRETTLQRLSFNTLPKEAQVKVMKVLQIVDSLTGQYDNQVEFVSKGGIPGVHITQGIFTPCAQDSSGRRLTVTFTGNGAYPAPDTGSLDDAAWCRALGLQESSVLEVPVSFVGWIDVTYADGDTRLMRGNAGNLFVLRRVPPS